MNRKPVRPIRAGRLIAVAAAAITLAGAAVAMGAVQRRGTTMVPPQSLGSAIAKCAQGQVALAGGFATPGYDPSSGPPVARFASMPDGARSVKTTGFNFSPSDPNRLDSFAYCGKRSNPPEVVSKSVDVPPDSFETVNAECPAGSKAIAGGFGTDQTVITLLSKRDGKRSWKVGGFYISDTQGSEPAELTAYAYCKSPGAKIVVESKDATVSSGLQPVDVECPGGAKVASGGFNGHFRVQGSNINAGGALTSKRADGGHGWTTEAISANSPNQAKITTYAYCRR
jgi:hypothetical protein